MITKEDEIIQRLRSEIEKTGHNNEVACAKELSEISHILLPALDESYYINKELNCHSGRADLVIIAERKGPGGKRKVAYVWELKAPQLHLFKMETKTRACPYSYLFEAENQLLHYHYELTNGGIFTDKWKISYNDIYLGGIIIGRDDNFIKKKNNEDDKNAEAQANIAMQIRKNRFYDSNKMELLTWDQVLRLAEKNKYSHRYYGDQKSVIDYSASVPVNIPTEPLGATWAASYNIINVPKLKTKKRS